MIEPVTAFGLSITALNIVLNTIPSLIDKGHQFVNYKRDHLERYIKGLEEARLSIITWHFTYGQENGWSEDDYMRMFGQSGWATIQRKRKEVEDLINNILGHLHLTEISKSGTDQRRSFRKSLKSSFRKMKDFFARCHDYFSQEIKSEDQSVSSEQVDDNRSSDPIKVTDDEIRDWQDCVREDCDATILYDDQIIQVDPLLPENRPKVRASDKIIALLYMNQQLDRKINDLEKAAGQLLRYSNDCYHSLHGGNPSSTPSGEDLVRWQRYHDLQHIANEVYKAYNQAGHDHRYKIHLRALDAPTSSESEFSEALELRTMYFTIVHRREGGQDPTWQKVSLTMLPRDSQRDVSANSLSTAMDNALQTSAQSPDGPTFTSNKGVVCQLANGSTASAWTRSLRQLLENATEPESELPMIFQLERARMAWKCTLWMILLWRTTWFSSLCSCALTAAMFPSSDAISPTRQVSSETVLNSASRWEFLFQSHSCGQTGHDHPRAGLCQTTSSKLFLLGILLAELCICRPIDVEFRNGELQPVRTDLWHDKHDIVDYLNRRHYGNGITLAVRYCLIDAFERGGWNVKTHSNDEKIRDLCEFVLKRVYAYMKMVENSWNKEWTNRLSHEFENLLDDESPRIIHTTAGNVLNATSSTNLGTTRIDAESLGTTTAATTPRLADESPSTALTEGTVLEQPTSPATSVDSTTTTSVAVSGCNVRVPQSPPIHLFSTLDALNASATFLHVTEHAKRSMTWPCRDCFAV